MKPLEVRNLHIIKMMSDFSSFMIDEDLLQLDRDAVKIDNY